MEITSRHNLSVELIRAERFGPAALLEEAVARGRATLDGPVLPGRPNGDAGEACACDAGLGASAVWAGGDVYEPSRPATTGMTTTHVDPPVDVSGAGMDSVGPGAVPTGGMLDVFA